MRSLTLSLILALITTSVALSQKEASANQDAMAQAQAILAQARAALGNEAKWQALNSLSIIGNYRRQMGNLQQEGEWQMDLLLPDKVRQAETFSAMGGVEITRLQALNGDLTWMDTQNNGNGHVVIRMAAPNATNAQAVSTGLKIDFARLMLGCLLKTPSSVPVEFSYAGLAEAPEGKADMLEVKHAGVNVGRLFIDQKTHQPLMLTYQSRKQQVMMTQRMEGSMPSPEEMEKRAKEAQERAASAPLVEMQMRFEDFRDESGLRLPHRITKSVGEETTEEIELTKFKLNPALKPDHFVKK